MNGGPFDFASNFFGGDFNFNNSKDFIDALTKKPTVKDIADKYPDTKKRVETACPWCHKKLAVKVSDSGYGDDGVKVVETKCPSCNTKIRLKVKK